MNSNLQISNNQHCAVPARVSTEPSRGGAIGAIHRAIERANELPVVHPVDIRLGGLESPRRNDFGSANARVGTHVSASIGQRQPPVVPNHGGQVVSITNNQLPDQQAQAQAKRSGCDEFKDCCHDFCQNRPTDRNSVKYSRCICFHGSTCLATVFVAAVCCCLLACSSLCGSGGNCNCNCDCSGDDCENPFYGPDSFGKKLCPCCDD